MKFIQRINEGQYMIKGINWGRDHMSRFRCCLWFWRIQLYFRWRSKYAGGQRFIFDMWFDNGYGIEFESMTVKIGKDVRYSREFLEDMWYLEIGQIIVRTEEGWVRGNAEMLNVKP